MTNYEHIKTLSIGEMSSFISLAVAYGEAVKFREKLNRDKIAEWLNQEAGIKNKHTFTPEQFKAMMLDTANNDNLDIEGKHAQMDGIMCSLLSELGYDDGVRIFNSTPKWYS